jgi:hypothetical protein
MWIVNENAAGGIIIIITIVFLDNWYRNNCDILDLKKQKKKNILHSTFFNNVILVQDVFKIY